MTKVYPSLLPKPRSTLEVSPLPAEELPTYTGSPYAEIHGNKPYFTWNTLSTEVSVSFSNLDALGRCGTARAIVSIGTMPTTKRKSLHFIHPSGWHSKKYDIVPGGYLFHRTHLIGFQLSGENANARNLITGTQYLNIQGMKPFETRVASALKQRHLHVPYRVTPIFDENSVIASGVLMEAASLEDNGENICLCIYCFNLQPGIEIDYMTGESREL